MYEVLKQNKKGLTTLQKMQLVELLNSDSDNSREQETSIPALVKKTFNPELKFKESEQFSFVV